MMERQRLTPRILDEFKSELTEWGYSPASIRTYTSALRTLLVESAVRTPDGVHIGGTEQLQQAFAQLSPAKQGVVRAALRIFSKVGCEPRLLGQLDLDRPGEPEHITQAWAVVIDMVDKFKTQNADHVKKLFLATWGQVQLLPGEYGGKKAWGIGSTGLLLIEPHVNALGVIYSWLHPNVQGPPRPGDLLIAAQVGKALTAHSYAAVRRQKLKQLARLG